MDLAAWRERQQEGELFETPSGLMMRLRRVSLLDLAEQGGIPTPLVGMVEVLLQRDEVSLTLEEVPLYAEVAGLVVKAAAISPPVVDEPSDDGSLGWQELPMSDRLAIFNWANGALRVLRPFRREPQESVDAA